MKKLVIAVLAIAGAYYAFEQSRPVGQVDATNPAPGAQPKQSRDQWRSGDQVRGTGTVSRILSDDSDGSRHQRFILQLSSGKTLLIAHNIDLAPRIASLREGDTVSFYGEYESNEQGGVIHWTHHDPQGRHAAGWLEHEGQRYQ